MLLEIEDEAREGARAAFRWYWERNPIAASSFEVELEQCFKKISERPLSLTLLGDHVRHALLQRFPFLVLFAIEPGCVRVLVVTHQGRRPPR